MESYKFLRSYFSEPIVSGQSNSNLAGPTIQFLREYGAAEGTEIITIHVDFILEGIASNFKFNVRTKSLFQIIDRSEIVASDVYNMQLKALEGLRSCQDYGVGDNGVFTIGVPTLEMHPILDELVDFVRRLKANKA